VNGEIGVIEAIDGSFPPTVSVRLDNGKVVSIQSSQWSNCEYVLETDRQSGKEVIRQREVGTFVQLPLKLAYAITVHKSQGLSLERVALKLGNGCFSHGQLYTALSRCRSIRNLRIDRQVYVEDVIIDQEVIDFYRELEAPPPERKEVTLTIPKEHEAAVMALLAQLRGEASPVPPPEPKRPNPAPPKPKPAKPVSEIPELELPFGFEDSDDEPPSDPDIEHLLIVYHNQTGDEVEKLTANRKNKIGFNKADAPLLTRLAEKYLDRGYLTSIELNAVRGRIAKYWKQWS